MQATTNDARYRPGVDMIAELHTLRQKCATLEKENAVLKRLWMRALDDSTEWEHRAKAGLRREVGLRAEAGRREAKSEPRGICREYMPDRDETEREQPRRRGWVRGWL